MTGRYAPDTQVSSDRSRAEIERTLRRYGASQFLYGWSGRYATLGFTAHGRSIRFELPLPDADDREFTRTDTGRQRTETAAAEAYDKAVRQRWRALSLIVKAKLEAVECGIATFEDEFLAATVLPGGATVADTVREHVADAYRTGTVPALLPDYRRAIESGGTR